MLANGHAYKLLISPFSVFDIVLNFPQWFMFPTPYSRKQWMLLNLKSAFCKNFSRGQWKTGQVQTWKREIEKHHATSAFSGLVWMCSYSSYKGDCGWFWSRLQCFNIYTASEKKKKAFLSLFISKTTYSPIFKTATRWASLTVRILRHKIEKGLALDHTIAQKPLFLEFYTELAINCPLLAKMSVKSVCDQISVILQ